MTDNDNKMILIVDDERIVTRPLRRLIDRLLKNEPYNLVTDNNPSTALDDLKKEKDNGTDLALVISDIMMPQMNGLDFLAKVKGLYPLAPQMVLTGYADKENAIRALNELNLFHYIEKNPWDDDKIRQLVLMALDKHRKDRMEAMFRRYVPYEVIEQFVDRSDHRIFEGQELEDATILFLDIVDFTQRTENMKADEAVSLLNEYFSALVEVIHGRGGILDKYIGDGLMALFGVPNPTSPNDDAQNAVLAAIDMVERVSELNIEREKKALEPLRIRIGLNTGKIIAGNIGSEMRINYTAVGDVVNTASRIENAARDFIRDDKACILISKNTYDKVKTHFEDEKVENKQIRFKSEGPVSLKGEKDKVTLYRVTY